MVINKNEEIVYSNKRFISAYCHYLWHLGAIGLFDHLNVRNDDGELKKEFKIISEDLRKSIWRELGSVPESNSDRGGDNGCVDARTKIAIIDVGVADIEEFRYGGPNRLLLSHGRDFGICSDGCDCGQDKSGYDYDDGSNPCVNDKYKTKIEFLFGSFKEEINKSEWAKEIGKLGKISPEEIAAKYKAILENELCRSKRIYDVDYCQMYSARGVNTSHGTSVAALVAGYRPLYKKELVIGGRSDTPSEFSDGDSTVENNKLKPPLWYFGVDPFANIVPIVTSHYPDPRELIAAFAYSWVCSDIILFPRDIQDPRKSQIKPEYCRRDEDVNWMILEVLITVVSRLKPVICAAGNDGRSNPIYPAVLSSRSAVISVGAVTYLGYRAGYSNYGFDRNSGKNLLTLVAPSGDSEVVNKHQIRIDKEDYGNEHINWNSYFTNLNRTNKKFMVVPHSAQKLLVPDIPGMHGYIGDGVDRLGIDDTQLAEFSGTSAACAIVAGVVSLFYRKHKLENPDADGYPSGEEVKAWLEKDADSGGGSIGPEDAVVGGASTLTADLNNESDEDLFEFDSENNRLVLKDKKSLRKWFGSGVVSVKALFKG